MYDVIVSEKNAKDKFFSVNEANELFVVCQGRKPKILCKNVSTDYDVIAEESGMISLMIAGLNGSLIYLKYLHGEWNKYTVLDSRGGSKRINCIKMIKFNGRIHAFYCIEYEGRMMLVHHISEDNMFLRKPHVIDYIGVRCSYDVCVDESYNIHILYTDEEFHIKYTVFINSKKDYSNREISCDDEIRSLNSVFFRNNLYAAYLSKEREYNVINCLKVDDGEKHTVGFGVDVLSEPCIFSSEDMLYIQWREKGYAFECNADNGFKFSKPFSLGRSESILKLRSYENETLSFISKCAGNMSKRPFPSAKNVFEKSLKKAKHEFRIKGSEAEEYAKQSLGYDEYKSDSSIEERMYALEKQLKNLIKVIELIAANVLNIPEKAPVHDVGEIDKENLEKFKNINPEELDVTKSVDTEYIEIKEESE